MKCNFCASEDNEVIWPYTRFERNNILKCRKCGLVFLEWKRNKRETQSFYTQEYRKIDGLPRKNPDEKFNCPIKKHDCKIRIEWIKNCYGDIKGKRVLEISSSFEAISLKK